MNKLFRQLLAGLLVSSACNVTYAECEDTVDMADSLRFEDLHVNCDKENKEKVSSIENNGATGKKGDSLPTIAARRNKEMATQQLSEGFSLAGGPLTAQTLLFQKMAVKCPYGWEISKQWVELVDQQASLNYQYNCLASASH